jgi:hypothetical protein
MRAKGKTPKVLIVGNRKVAGSRFTTLPKGDASQGTRHKARKV